jgi:hypothetical protein
VFGDLGVDGSDPRLVFRNSDFPDYTNDDPAAGTVGGFGYPGAPEHYSYTAPMIADPAGSGLWYLPDDTIVEDPAGSSLYYPDGDGMLIFEDPTDTGLGLVVGGDLIPAEAPDTCPSNWELTFARADLTTQVLLSRRDDDVPHIYPTPTQLVDTANGFAQGLSMFGVEPFQRDDLETVEDVDLDFLAERILTIRSWRFMPRVAAVTVTALGSHPETYGTLASASPFLPARFRCQHRVDDRIVFNRVMLVTGVAHTITPAGWEARISLDDAEPFLVGGAQPAHWDETGVALWDFTTWADPT